VDNQGYRHTLRICNTFPLQQRLRERVSMLRNTYNASLLFSQAVKRLGHNRDLNFV